MRGMILLADEFEDLEAIGTIDLVKRADILLDTVSMNDTTSVHSKYGLHLNADYLVNEISLDNYDFLIIPGGSAVVKTHLQSKITEDIIWHFEKKHQLIACICAAPSILGKLGLLGKAEFTCFPGFERYVKDGIYQENKRVVVSKNHITSKSAGTVTQFAHAIIKYLKNEKVANQVLKNIHY